MILTRALAGIALGLAIALAARRAHSLDTSGAIAATIIGAITMTAGWGWGALLIVYFAASSALSRWRRAEKEARTGSVVEKGGARDARQVLANGGVYALAAIASLVAVASDSPPVALLAGAAGAGALAAAAADTWATEIGVLARRPPRSILSGRTVAAGTSGAVSWPGMAALVAGAACVALLARALGVSTGWAAFVGGVAGAMADTLLGATLQERRWCDRCELSTERRVHACGATTRRAGGVARLDNDVVNVACTLVGAAAGALTAAAAVR